MSLSGEYWAAWNSYVFTKIEGKGDNNGDGTFDDPQIALHLGSNEALRTPQFDKNIHVHEGMATELDVIIDVQKIFDNGTSIYDILDSPSLHSLDQMTQINELSDNFQATIKIQ